MGLKVSADEMIRAGVAIDALASEWTPTRSDADKQAEYAQVENRKRLGERVKKVFEAEAQGAKTTEDFAKATAGLPSAASQGFETTSAVAV